MSAGRKWPLGPIIIGLGGFFVLVALGVWQSSKVQWKNSIIAEAEKRLEVAPVPLPKALNPDRDDYKRVIVEGGFDHAEERYFLTSTKREGPGFSIITPFQTKDGRRVLVDRGYVPEALRDPAKRVETSLTGPVTVEGVLRWPDDRSWATPDPDPKIREWYSREVGPLADALNTEPVLIQQSPVDRAGWPRGGKAQVNIRNQHLPYAIQWFAIALVWAVMSFVWLRKVACTGTPE